MVNVRILMRTILCAVPLLGSVSCKESMLGLSAGKATPNVVAVTAEKSIATVVAVNADERTVRLKGADGREHTYQCGKDMVNFDQIKVGDRVNATVTDSVAVFVRKSDAEPLEGEAAAVAIAPQGYKPGVVMADTAEVRAKILAVDKYAGTITIETPEEMTTLQVSRGVDLTPFKKGDDVTLRVSESLALLVEAPASGSPTTPK